MTEHQLGPLPGEAFAASKIDAIVLESIEEFFKLPDAANRPCEELATQLSDFVRSSVRAASKLTRHKIVVQSVVTRNIGQSMCVASKCLWDAATDNYSSTVWKSSDGILIATVMVFALYQS
jgi:hypothetical protein